MSENKFNKMCPICGGQKTDRSVPLFPFFKPQQGLTSKTRSGYCECDE